MSEPDQRFRRGKWRRHVCTGDWAQHGKPDVVEAWDLQPDAREGQAGPGRVAERPVVPTKPGNAGGGKGPWFEADVERSKGPRRMA